MKDKVKKALKRASSGLLAVLLAVCLVGTPRAKAVVSEGALLGSLFGSLLVSMGYSWAADNFDAPTFGEAIYDLIKECDEEMDTGIQLLLDSQLAGVTAVGNGKLTFSQQWVKLANSFAEWLEVKFFDGTTQADIVSYTPCTISFSYNGFKINYPDSFTNKSGNLITLSSGNSFNIPITSPTTLTFLQTSNLDTSVKTAFIDGASIEVNGVKQTLSNGNTALYYKDNRFISACYTVTQADVDLGAYLVLSIRTTQNHSTSDSIPFSSAVVVSTSVPLTAEKPQEVHYPDVAEDGSQVYEITVDGVTATDIEGIIQGAVDRILAGTAAIAGEVTQAGTGEIVENPEIDPYKVGLSSVFPFCIPFDVYNMVTMFVAEPEAPSAEWSFTLPWSSQEYSVGWDLSAFDGVARVCRDMELVLFAVGLAVITYKVIKW